MSENCPGIPEECDHARRVMLAATNGVVPAPKLQALRDEIDHCVPCLNTFDMEIHFRAVMSRQCRELAPDELRLKITECLERVDLRNVDVTDL